MACRSPERSMKLSFEKMRLDLEASLKSSDISEEHLTAFVERLGENLEEIRAEIASYAHADLVSDILDNISKRFEELEAYARSEAKRHKKDREILLKLTDLCMKLFVRVRVLTEDNDKLALRQAVNVTRLKILSEIAKEDREQFADMAMNRYKYFPRLQAPFADRWQLLKQKLGITKDEKLISRMENDAVDAGNVVAHEKFSHTYEELVAVAKSMRNSSYYLFFLDLNRRLNALRPGDGLFDAQDKAFIT